MYQEGTYNALRSLRSLRSLPSSGIHSLDHLPQPTAASTSWVDHSVGFKASKEFVHSKRKVFGSGE
jgi:hypothetical protein